MRLRRATPEDHEVVGRATVAAYAPYVGEDRDYVNQLADAGARDEQAELWVVEDDGTILGSVTICPEGSPWRELAQPGEGEFRMLAVDPVAQGRGIGRSLIEHAVERFRMAGATGVVICSMSEMTRAHGLYERFGFTRDRELDWSPVPDVDLLAFRLTFAPKET